MSNTHILVFRIQECGIDYRNSGGNTTEVFILEKVQKTRGRLGIDTQEGEVIEVADEEDSICKKNKQIQIVIYASITYHYLLLLWLTPPLPGVCP